MSYASTLPILLSRKMSDADQGYAQYLSFISGKKGKTLPPKKLNIRR